jgi:hypothetical protein
VSYDINTLIFLSIHQDQSYNGIIFQCVDSAVSAVLGRDSRATLFYAIQIKFNMNEGELQRSPLKVIEGLNSILGSAGYVVLEPAIISEIKSRFGISHRKASDLHSVLEESRKLFLKS